MAENKKDIVVYILSDRKTYHLYRECPYLSRTDISRESIKESSLRKVKSGSKICQACKRNKKKEKNYILINKNNQLTNIQLSNNRNDAGEQNNFGFKKFRSVNQILNNNKIMNSIIEEEKDSELNESNFSMSRVSHEFTDSLAISNSFENVLKKLFQFEEKKNQYEFNNFKNFGKIANKGIYNKNNKESNNIIENNNSISNNSDECDISESIKKITFKNILLKKEDDEKKEEIFNDKIKKDKIRDINGLKIKFIYI